LFVAVGNAVRCVWGRPALPTLLMMSWPATRSNFSCWNHRFIVLCSAVNQRNKDPIRPDPDMGPRPSPPSTNQSSNPVNSCHPLSKSKRFKYISPDLGAETRHNCRFVREVRWMENRGKWKWVGVRGSGFGATNTNCTFQPESCMCVCWPQLLFSKES